MAKCKTPGCDNEGKGTLCICHNCYNSMLRWAKRSPSEQSERLDKLRLYESRMESTLPTSVTKRKFTRSSKPWSVIPGQILKKRKKRKG